MPVAAARTGPGGAGGWARTVGRLLLGAFLVLAGVSHLTWAREEFQAQVPGWLPLAADPVVLASGVLEVGLGAALVAVGPRRRALVGWAVAAFFVAVLPGNVSQLLTRSDAFGLDTDLARAVRLLFQPLLVLWALWSTGAWATRPWARGQRSARRPRRGGPAGGGARPRRS